MYGMPIYLLYWDSIIYLKTISIIEINFQEYRPWQQFQLEKAQKYFHFYWRTRLEERKRQNFSEISVRFRQRITLQSTKPLADKFYPVVYDELFFNLNQVEWIDTNTLNQNRMFLGFDINFKSFILQLGYLNRVRFETEQNNITHILQLTCTF